jgi:hypothetical protein
MSYGIELTKWAVNPSFQSVQNSQEPLTTAVFRKVICTKNFEKQFRKNSNSSFIDAEIEVVSETDLPSRVLDFLRNWETESFSHEELEQEQKMWEHFFQIPRYAFFSIDRINFYRHNHLNKKFEISIINTPNNYEGFTKIFHNYGKKNNQNPTNYQDLDPEKIIKEKIRLNLTSDFFEQKSQNFDFDTSLALDLFVQKYRNDMKLCSTDPFLLKKFAASPTIDRLVYLINKRGAPLLVSLTNAIDEKEEKIAAYF